MAERTQADWRRKLLMFLGEAPNGVARSNLHSVGTDIKAIHAALDTLIAEGLVEERLIMHTRGKPRREYILAGRAHQVVEMPRKPAILPGARDMVVEILKRNPGATRTELWREAVPTQGWVGATLDTLVSEGVVREELDNDPRGGLVRRYFPVGDGSTDGTEDRELVAQHG